MSTTSKFDEMITLLRKDINKKEETIQIRADRQEKDMKDYQDFCDFCDKKEKMDLRKKKISCILND